jgi:hypothetical protein
MSARGTKALSRLIGSVALLAVSALGAACSSNVEPTKPTVAEGAPVFVPFAVPDLAADGMHQVVAIIDSGFDLSLPHFRGKIAGGYTIKCAPQEKPASNFDDAKAELLARYAVKDTHCHLVPGITLRKSANLDASTGDLAAWNRAFAEQTLQLTPGGLWHFVLGEDTYNYHGTWTSSLIAYHNPNVLLVFVANENQERSDAPTTCPTPEALRQSIALAQDSDIRAAYVASPPSSYSDELAGMFRHHGVTLLNESFGSWPLAKLQALCPSVADLLATQTAIDAEVATARELAINVKEFDGVALMRVHSAGNDGLVVSSLADRDPCPTDPRHVAYGTSSADVMIGSWTATNSSPAPAVSRFSNSGPCVSFYAPGDDIVSMSPDGFLAVLRGTSFSAPLVVRHLSLMPPGTTPAAMLQALEQVSPLLPMEWFPSALLYDLAAPTPEIVF